MLVKSLSLVCYGASWFGIVTWWCVTSQLCLCGALQQVGTWIVLSLLLLWVPRGKVVNLLERQKNQANSSWESMNHFPGNHLVEMRNMNQWAVCHSPDTERFSVLQLHTRKVLRTFRARGRHLSTWITCSVLKNTFSSEAVTGVMSEDRKDADLQFCRDYFLGFYCSDWDCLEEHV